MAHSSAARAQHSSVSRVDIGLVALVLLALAALRYALALRLPLSVDESYYMAWSRTLDWGYWTKPPLIAWAMSLLQALLGQGKEAVRVLPILAYSASALLLFDLARRMAGGQYARWVALLFMTLPLISFYGFAATTDCLLLLCWVAAMRWFYLSLQGERFARLAVGVAVGLGLLAKYSMAVWLVSAWVILLLPAQRAHLRSAWPWVAALLALLIFVPNLLWNATHGAPTLQHTAAYAQGGTGGLDAGRMVQFWAEKWLIANPVLVTVAAFAVGGLLRRGKAVAVPDAFALVFALAFALPMLAVVSAQALTGKANANWAAPAVAGLTLAGTLVLHRAGRWRWLGVALALNAGFALLLYAWQPLVARPLQLPLGKQSDPYWMLRAWPDVLADVARAAQARQPARPLAQLRVASDDRAVLAQAQAVFDLPAGAAQGWLRKGYADNHFDQRFPLHAAQAQGVLLITQADAATVRAAFAHAEYAGQARSVRVAGAPLAYGLWWL